MFNKNANISLIEKNLIDEHLNQAKSITFNKHITYDWLLSEWNNVVWLLTGWNGSKSDPIKIHWAQLLPNGDLLTDDKYSHILERTKRVIALMRSGEYSTTTRSERQRHTSIYLFSLIRWMILNGFNEAPYPRMSYDALSKNDYALFCSQVEYGIPGVEAFYERVKDYMAELTDTAVASILDSSGLVNRKVLGNKLNIEFRRLSIPRIDILLREYETCKEYPVFYISDNNKSREYIGNRVDKISVLSTYPASETVANDLLNIWELLHTHSHNTDGLLSFNPIGDTTRSAILSDINYKEKGRTPNVPLDIALQYINESITWVIEYGATLVELNNGLELKMGSLKENRTGRDDYYAPQAFDKATIPKTLTPLNITRFNKHQTGTSREVIRDNLSVKDAMDCLVAACFILIATFSARRHEEIVNLTVDCIKDDYDGYVIEFLVQKASSHHLLETLQRPIPSLVLMAANLLEEINKKLRITSNIDEYANLLFLKSTKNGVKKLTNLDIVKKLDLFADIIESHTFIQTNDETETVRRWYLRPHECRRFYAYTYLWSTPDSKLEALSWFMSHGGLSETERYTSNTLSGSEFPEFINILTINALLSDDAKNDAKTLKKMALNHFDAERIEFIDERLLDTYIQHLYASKQLSIEIINTPESLSGKSICIHIAEETLNQEKENG